MEYLSALWMPIVVSAVLVFVVSSIIHMATPMHKGDYGRLPDEDKFAEALRGQNVQPGEYMFPGCHSMKDMGTPEMQERYKRGPVGHMMIMAPGVPSIGKNLVQWFLFSLLVSAFAAWVGGHSIQWGADFKAVFPICAVAAGVAYAFGYIPAAIWKGMRWSTAAKFIFDGAVYGIVTGAAFGFLWPSVV